MPVHIGPASLIDAYIGDRPIGEMYMGGTRIWERPRGESWDRVLTMQAIRNSPHAPANNGVASAAAVEAVYPDVVATYTGQSISGVQGCMYDNNEFDDEFIAPSMPAGVFRTATSKLVLRNRDPLPSDPVLYAEVGVYPQHATNTAAGLITIQNPQFTLEIPGVARYAHTWGEASTLTDLTVGNGATVSTSPVSPIRGVKPIRDGAGGIGLHGFGIYVSGGYAHVTYYGRGVIGSVRLSGEIPASVHIEYTSESSMRVAVFVNQGRYAYAVRDMALRTGRMARDRIALLGFTIPDSATT